MNVEWKRVLIKPEECIRHALELMDRESLRILLVVDGDLRLLGVISDGDIRRGLLRSLALTAEVSAVMNSAPLTAKFGTSRADLVRMMEANQVLAVPLLDGAIVCGLVTFQEQVKKGRDQNPGV